MAWVSLKTQNLPTLALVMIAQVVVAYGLSNADFNWASLNLFSPDTVIVTLIIVLAGLFSSLLPASVKHQLVFLRLNNVLPGHRFLQLAAHDPRIDLLALQHRVMPLMPLNAEAHVQNRVWYQYIYQPLQQAPLVKDSHKAFLLWRDSMVVSLVIAVMLALGFAALPLVAAAFSPYSLLVSLLFAMSSALAAHHHGKRMVTNAVVTWLMQPRSNQKY